MNAGKTSYGVVDTKKLFSIIDFYRANMDSNAEEMSWDQQQAAFAGGKSAMMVQGLWSYGAAIGTNPKLDCGFIPFPVFNDARMNKFYADVDSTFGLSSQASAEKQAAGKKFLEWLATPAGHPHLDLRVQADIGLQGSRHVRAPGALRAAHGERGQDRGLPVGVLDVPHRGLRGCGEERRAGLRV